MKQIHHGREVPSHFGGLIRLDHDLLDEPPKQLPARDAALRNQFPAFVMSWRHDGQIITIMEAEASEVHYIDT